MRFLISLEIFMIASLLCLTFNVIEGVSQDSKSAKARMGVDGIQRLDLIVDSYSFEPNHIVVDVDNPVEITLKSVTSIIRHNFSIDYPDDGLSIDQNVSSGEDVTISFTPIKPGNYDFICDKKGIFGRHVNKGMKGVLEVKGSEEAN